VCDLAVLDRDDGDEPVVVGVPGADGLAVDGVFEDDDEGRCSSWLAIVVVHGELPFSESE